MKRPEVRAVLDALTERLDAEEAQPGVTHTHLSIRDVRALVRCAQSWLLTCELIEMGAPWPVLRKPEAPR